MCSGLPNCDCISVSLCEQDRMSAIVSLCGRDHQSLYYRKFENKGIHKDKKVSDYGCMNDRERCVCV